MQADPNSPSPFGQQPAPPETEEIRIDGIPIALPSPRPYLESLARGLRFSFPGDPAFRAAAADLERLLGPAAAPRAGEDVSGEYPESLAAALGWASVRRLGPMLDREWLVDERCELPALVSALTGTPGTSPPAAPAGSASPKALVIGAGVCGLGGELARRSEFAEVCCSDLSYPALHVGRAMIRGEAEKLPLALRQPRKLYEPSLAEGLLRERASERVFRRPEGGEGGKVSFRVADIFGPGDLAANFAVVYLPHVLDLFEPGRLETALVRLAETLSEGARLVLAMAFTSRRDPNRMLRALAACGYRPARLELRSLPHSFSRFDAGFLRQIHETVIVEAVKQRTPAARPIGVRLEPGAPEADGLAAGERAALLALAPLLAAVSEGSLSYDRLLAAATAELGRRAADAALSHLTSTGALTLMI